MANNNVDILMKLEDDKGAILAESQSLVSKKDEYTKDFEATKFFDIEEFDFDVALDGTEESDNDTSSSKTTQNSADKNAKKKTGAFSRWLGGIRDLKKNGYPVEVQPFQFTRQFDWASPTLFQLCANSTPLKQATMVQRKAGTQTEEGINAAFLRIEFVDVLLTGVSWDLADAVLKEKVKFVCRKIKVKYKMQDETGAPWATTYGEWTFNNTVK